MFIRLYVNSKNESEVQAILAEFLNKFQPVLKSKEIQRIEPYWKMEDAYVVELDLLLLDGENEIELNRVLMSISDKWLKFGSPTNELLAAEKTVGCTYIY